jgi:hypothetical protein
MFYVALKLFPKLRDPVLRPCKNKMLPIFKGGPETLRITICCEHRQLAICRLYMA